METKETTNYLTIVEAADRLKVDRRIVEALMANGRLKYSRLSKRVIRIREVDLDSLFLI